MAGEEFLGKGLSLWRPSPAVLSVTDGERSPCIPAFLACARVPEML